GLTGRVVGGTVAGDERQPLGARVEAVAAQAAPDAVGGDDEAAPLLAPQLGGDAPRPQPGVGDGEGEDALLEQGRELVRHQRPPHRKVDEVRLGLVEPPAVSAGWGRLAVPALVVDRRVYVAEHVALGLGHVASPLRGWSRAVSRFGWSMTDRCRRGRGERAV